MYDVQDFVGNFRNCRDPKAQVYFNCRLVLHLLVTFMTTNH